MNVALRPELRAVSLFSGGGGLDHGISLATGGRARTVGYVERDAYAAACLVARMEAAALAPAPVWDDVSTFDARAWRGAVDCVVGGSPCQDLSLAGKRAGLRGSRSGLFFEFVRIARDSGAWSLFWENVGGAASALPAVFDAFAEIGFTGACVKVRASDVGAPHQRARFFLLAYRDGSEERFKSWWRGGTNGAGAAFARDARGDMADRDRGRQSQRGAPHDHDRSDAPGHDADGCDARLADSGRSGREGRERAGAPCEGAGTPRPTAERGRPLEWPPGPDALDAWKRVLSVRPDLSPAEPRVRRVAHGVAGGVELPDFWADRLRVLGNGVVPAQAAAAFTFLADHLCGVTP